MKHSLLTNFVNAVLLFSGLSLTAEMPAPYRLKTSTMEVMVENGIITEVKDLRNGCRWADSSKNDAEIPSGLGILKDLKEFRKIHTRNGTFENDRALKPGFSLMNYYRPCSQSDYTVKKLNDGSAKLIWKGLSNQKEFLPDAEFYLELKPMDSGALRLRAGGSWPKGNVYGAATSVANLDRGAEGILPVYGGRRIPVEGKSGMIVMQSKSDDMEAPVMILTNPKKRSLSFWIEDPSIRNYMAYLNRSEKSQALIFEHCNLMCFDDKTSAASPDVFLNVFRGDWKAAAKPYRDYYHRQYKADLAARSAVEWEKSISTSVGQGSRMFSDRELDLLKRYYPAGSMLIMTWRARAPKFDRELPDWTPREGYVDGVVRAHKAGFKAMSYVNVCCANYMSPAWEKHGLGKFFLPYRVSLDNYHQPKPISYKKDQLYYGDLLSPGWRKFHVELMKEWCNTTGTDALYEDCVGCAADRGNGVVSGLSGAQGEREQLRMLRKELPDKAFASEYLTQANAAAIHWPLKYFNYSWFTLGTKWSMIHDYRPVSAYLYGNRPWITERDIYSPFDQHIRAALADSIGGMGFVEESYYRNKTAEEIEADYSFGKHIHQRSVLFAQKQLRPFFPETDYPENINCTYQGSDGIYSYYDDGILQQMISPEGKPLYARTTGSDRIKTSLRPGCWPVYIPGMLCGLNPKGHYPLFRDMKTDTAVKITELSQGSYVRKYFEDDSVFYLELDSISAGKNIAAKLQWDPKYRVVTANGKIIKPGKLSMDSPVILIGFKNQNEPLNSAHAKFVKLLFTGQMATSPKGLSKRPNRKNTPKTFRSVSKGNYVLFFAGKVDQTNRNLEIKIHDKSALMAYLHDGMAFRLKINGQTVREYDTTGGTEPKWISKSEERKKMFDQKPRSWTVPLNPYLGKTILVFLEIDARNNVSGDKADFSIELK